VIARELPPDGTRQGSQKQQPIVKNLQKRQTLRPPISTAGEIWSQSPRILLTVTGFGGSSPSDPRKAALSTEKGLVAIGSQNARGDVCIYTQNP